MSKYICDPLVHSDLSSAEASILRLVVKAHNYLAVRNVGSHGYL